jgi:hypothetical protein
MYQGALPLAVQELTSWNGTSGVQIRGTFLGGDNQVINIPVGEPAQTKPRELAPSDLPDTEFMGSTSTTGTRPTIEDEFKPIPF